MERELIGGKYQKKASEKLWTKVWLASVEFHVSCLGYLGNLMVTKLL